MKTGFGMLVLLAAISSTAQAQDGEYAAAFNGPASIGSQEPLFRYDDQERWKHGYLKNMPFYGGHRYFRPYNYHHVFSQSSAAAGWGMSPVMPYSQQFWHRYEAMIDLSRGQHTPVQPYDKPVPQFDHYPKPLPGAPSTSQNWQSQTLAPQPDPGEYLTPAALSASQSGSALPALVVPPAPAVPR